MKLRNIIFGLFASAAVLVSCNPDEELLGPASLKVNGSEVTLSKDGDTKTIALKATREWTASISPEESGFTVSPMSGTGSNDPQTITVTAEANTGKDAHAILTITSGELEPVSVRLYQPGEEGGNWTLKELRDWGTETPFPLGAKTEVTVVSNKDISTVTNVTAFVQDETAGLQLRFASAHSFAKGEKISVLLEGLKLTTYQDAIQIDAIPVDNATSISTGNTVAAKTTSLEDFMANRLEGQYIELDVNVQPRADFQNEPEEDVPAETPDNPAPEGETDTPAEPTSTEDTEEVVWKFVNNTSLTYDEVWFETETGENFTIKTYKGSVIKDTPIPANSGKIKGIANIQEGRLQIIFTSTDDFAGLDQPYFESAHYVNFDKAADWVSQEAGAYTLKVSSNTAWTVSASGSWVTLDKTSGEGDAEIIVTYAAATEGATEANSTELTFSYAGKTKVFALTQKMIETLTIDEFTAKEVSTDTYYRLEGTFDEYYSFNDSQKKGRFYLKDANGDRILVYQTNVSKNDSETEFSTLGLRQGDGIVVEGLRAEYNGTAQMSYAYVISTTDNTPDLPLSTIASVLELELTASNASEKLSNVKVEGTVVAVVTNGFIVADATGNLFVFTNSAPTVKVGNKVVVEGCPVHNYGTPQLTKNTLLEITVTDDSEVAPDHGTAEDLTSVENLNAFVAMPENKNFFNIRLVKVTGEMSEGYKILQPSESAYAVALYNSGSFPQYNGAKVTVIGYYYNYYSSSKTIRLTPVSITAEPFVSVVSDAVEVAASATSAKISVNANVAWTVTTDADWIKSYTQSGENGGDVEITFDAYESTEADRTATFTISAEGQESITVTLVQKKYVAPTGEQKVDVIDQAFAGLGNTTSYKDWSDKAGSASVAVYAGNSAGETEIGDIRIRTTNSNSGVVSTVSGGILKKVVITWNNKTSGTKKIQVYGSNSAYTAPADLYDSEKQGTYLGEVSFTRDSQETVTTIEVSGEYGYVGIRSSDGTCYLDKIEITWEN